MKLRRLGGVARKEWLHVLRDPRSLGMGIAMPLLLLLLFGYALTLDVDNVALAVWDQSQTPASRDLLSRFSGSRYFRIRRRVDTYRQLQQTIEGGEALGGLVIPRGFAQDLGAGRQTAVQLLLDGSDSNTATIALGYAEAILAGYNVELIANRAGPESKNLARGVIEARPRVWFNDELSSRNAIIPGLVPVIMMVVAALLTSLTIAREHDHGTMEQLASTPVSAGELIAGKLTPYFAIGMVDVGLAVAMGHWLFAVPLRGSVLLVFASAAVFLAGALGMGMLISIVARTQLLATQIAMVATFLPAFLLSDFVYPVVNMPWPIRAITHVVPARYFVTAIRWIYMKGASLPVIAMQLVFLVGFAVVVLAVARDRLRRQLE